IMSLAFDDGAVTVNGEPRVWPMQPPTIFFATPFDADMASRHLQERMWPTAQRVVDDSGLASGALIWKFDLEARTSRKISLDIPLSGHPPTPRIAPAELPAWVDQQREAVARAWHEKLGRVEITVPTSAQPIVDTLRTALAHILINRDGVQIRPGTRSYARSWIRDGAMTAEALLRLGHAEEARDFLTWYAPYQFANGKVPCCVDTRGADPVPENDSHGELIFLAAEAARYTQDRALAETMWPHVEKATRYMDELRASERTEANRGTEKFGLLPPSISHEGYSAKPAYSHWDNFWGLIGYKSAIRLAEQLGRDEALPALNAARDQFRTDILASINASAEKFDIDFIPGAADLGDFDATSTTIALSPGGEREHLPEAMLVNTFERYWNEFVQRRDGQRAWKDYTPYEWRNVSAFIRLGWRERAHAAIDYFFSDRRPQAWNQWAEVVGREAREPRFIGDMPHGWVASDFIRAALDLFAWERESDQSLVLAAGIPSAWLDGEGVSIEGLHTPYGVIGYSLRRDGNKVLLSVRGDAQRMPAGGYVWVWPDASAPGRTRTNGKPAKWTDRELRIMKATAEVVVHTDEMP
ncbi:MAG: coagulation factor 5/8 type domain-containing protein, partial [Dokdonella sp.]